MDGEFDFFAPLPGQSVTPSPAAAAPLAASRMGLPSPSMAIGQAPQPKASRWAKSDTTFGPVGRVVSTFALIVPFLFLAVAGIFTFDPFVLGGAGIWAFLMMMGLRQVWQAVQHHHRR